MDEQTPVEGLGVGPPLSIGPLARVTPSLRVFFLQIFSD